MYEMKLRVTMLGDFSLSWCRKTMDLENAGAKVLQVWQALLYAGDEGVSREALQLRLYGVANDETANSLRALVFRLRRFLTSRGMDGAKSVRVRGGVYLWSGPRPVVDAHRFIQAAEKALASTSPRRLEAIAKAATLYTGRLLPQTPDETLKAEGDRLEGLYLQCLRQLLPALRQDGEHEMLLKLSTQAAQILPSEEEWTLCRLDSLIALGRCDEAMQVYQQAVDRLASEQGVSPSDAMMSRFKTLSSQLRFSLSDLATVQADLWEESVGTSYYCSYPGFVDCYRLATRRMNREKTTGFLMLCTLTDVSGSPLPKGPRQKSASDALRESIGDTLRGSDVYTCYSPNQYLILLLGLKAGDCDRVIRRLREGFAKQSAAWGCRLKVECAQATAPAPHPRRDSNTVVAEITVDDDGIVAQNDASVEQTFGDLS